MQKHNLSHVYNRPIKINSACYNLRLHIRTHFNTCVGTQLFYHVELKKMDPLQFCLPIFLGIHRNPRQKDFFNSCKGFLKLSHLSTCIHLDKHLDGAYDIFWIESLNGTFLALQTKAFGPKKKIKFHAGVKQCHFGTFSERAGMAVSC